MDWIIHKRVFLYEVEYDKKEEKFFVGDKEVERIDIIGNVVYISQREKVTMFEGKKYW